MFRLKLLFKFYDTFKDAIKRVKSAVESAKHIIKVLLLFNLII